MFKATSTIACALFTASLATAETPTPPVAGEHWSFQPVRDVAPPQVDDALSAHPIDRFIRARQQAAGLNPVGLADRRALIRRASYDLTGLPPTPEQVKAFLKDERPNAFAEMIDQFLASPRYGERWGRHWLDLARYADTAGENSDYPIPQAYLYRDYVIDSFNADKPYDVFLHEQIAGDILGRMGEPEEYAERVIATGFLAQAKRFGTRDLEDMHLIIEDTLDTIGKVTMGLVMRCARCHDHKYDPTTMKDYYALYGFFQSTSYPYPGGESDRVQKYFAPLVHPDVLARQDKDYFAGKQPEIDRLKAELKAAKPKGDKAVKAVQAKIDAINNAAPGRRVPVAYAVHEGKATDAHVQKLGNPRSKGDLVKRAVPSFLNDNAHLSIPEGASGRLQFAEWLTDPKNPLTARVMVNRIWQHHFGKPIVATPSDFGIQGAKPTHPELLDWLARRFIESGWSVKAMHRLILSSKTWQLASGHDAVNEAKDSANAHYWKFDRRRLDAESIRDSMLLMGGNLNLARPGAHPFPPADKWRFSAHRQFKAVYPSNHRSVYLMVQRLHPHPFISVFNGPDTSATTAMRDQSTVPQQALFMSNSKQVEEQAAGFAKELANTESDSTERVRRAYWRAFSREPNERELQRAATFLSRYAELAKADGVAEQQRDSEAWAALARTMLTSNEFVFVD